MPEIESHRWEGVWRLTVGLIWLTFVWFVGIFLGIVFAVWWALDVFWQIVTGMEGLDFGRSFVKGLWQWSIANSLYVIFGEGGYQIIPTRA